MVAGSLHTRADNPTCRLHRDRVPAHRDSTPTALDWRPTFLTWSVDGNAVPGHPEENVTWHRGCSIMPMFLILNLAIGGTMGGNPPAAGGLPYQMVVKSVNLYNAEVS